MARDLFSSETINLDDTVEGQLKPRTKVNLAQVSVTHPSPLEPIAVVGTGDQELSPSVYGANFITVLDQFETVTSIGSAFTVLPDGRVRVNIAGWIKIDGYADVSHSNNNATVGAAFAITRGAADILSPRSVHARMPNAGNIGNITGMGTLLAEPNDIIGIALASDVSGTVSIHSSSLVFDYKGAA